MDKRGSIVVKPSFDDAYPFSEGYAPVQIGDRWGYIDKRGEMAIPRKYRIAHMFNEGVASVTPEDTGKWGYIDHTGAFAIQPIFDGAMPFCAGVAPVATFHRISPDPKDITHQVKYRGRRGFIDHSGKYIWRDLADH